MNSRPHPSAIPPGQSRARRTDSLGWENASNASVGSSSADFQQRRDFSPSAMPPPLATRPFPGPVVPENGPGLRYPPRKSSLSQLSPVQATSPPTQPVSVPGDNSPGPGYRQLPPSSAAVSETETSGSKPLPFIRPADIYKRVEEERQKERASTDSERPSIHSLNRVTSGDATTSELRSRSSSESSSRPAVRKPSFDRGNEGSPFTSARSPLEPVQERKSVYEPDETSRSGQAAPAAVIPQTTAKTSEPEAAAPASDHMGLSSSRPLLPQINPSSAFGDDVLSMTGTGKHTEPVQDSSLGASQPRQSAADTSKDSESSDGLQHQPSLGFRSVVNQAFDRRDDSSVPPTPLSNQDQSLSRGGSAVSRSNTDSTAGISPIISRTSSAANAARNQTAEARVSSTPAIAEEPDNSSLNESRRPSSGTLHGTQQVHRKPSPSHSRQEFSDAAKGFVPGYRRSLDPPSSENSPARTPNVEKNKQLVQSETGELSTRMSDDELSDRLELAKSNNSQSEFRFDVAGRSLPENVQGSDSAPRSPISRAESPSKGRVRDLAGRFNNIRSSSNRSSMDSLKSREPSQIENSNPAVSSVDSTATAHPQEQSRQDEQLESRAQAARPRLPGGWVSEAPSDISATGADDVKEAETVNARADAPISSYSTSTTSKPTDRNQPAIDTSEAPDLTPVTNRAPAGSDLLSNTIHPIAGVTAAGSAIAASIAQATGATAESEQSNKRTNSVQQTPEQHGVGDIYVRPLAPDRTASSAVTSPAPTPLPKDTPPSAASKPRSEYFASAGLGAEQVPSPVNARPLPRTTTDDSLHDSENERLRSEIERQLTPEIFIEDHNVGGSSFQDKPTISHRSPAPVESAPLPQNHETYSPEKQSGVPMASSLEVPPPHLSHRFSWESDDAVDAPSELPATLAEETDDQVAPAESAAAGPHTSQGDGMERSLPEMTGSAIHEQGIDERVTESPVSPDQPEFGTGLDGLQRAFTDSAPTDNPGNTAQMRQQAPGGAFESTQPNPTNQTRIPPFREILAMKEASGRIVSYNQTREQFAGLDSGLSEWVTSIMAAHPEYASLTSPEARTAPSASVTSTTRHKATPSLLKLGKLPTSGHAQQPSVSSNLGDEEESAPMTSPTKPAQGSTGRVTSQQMQAKGKDLLKNAGVLGGKATIGAKGLFAKGRNRLQNRGSDKVDS